MGTVIKELVTQGHELVALLGTQHGMHDAASLVQRLTAQLDITAVALREMTGKRDAEHGDVLTWEKTMFKVCGEDGHKSVAAKFAELEAKCAALAAENAGLKKYICDECYVENVRTGRYACAGHGIPSTPATDSYLAEVRAQGVELFAASLKVVGGHEHPYSSLANEFAAQLRKGGNQ
ncbi:Uncharacterised protein [Kluyvera cryocrescens]|uniref:Uncharacterized protein n=1 Tax=Kluyvera cryocrescens TaxID=580 RepID=A0A485B604_KLUCR|nr:Uncharacterised protein [Kluyvera cryocrescens]